jgi:hypothetical protein
MRDKPLFFSEDSKHILFPHSIAMDTFKKLSEVLSEKEAISQQEFDLLNTAFSVLSEEQQAEVKDTLSEVEEKVAEEEAPAAEAGR